MASSKVAMMSPSSPTSSDVAPPAKRTADDVWREIIAHRRSFPKQEAEEVDPPPDDDVSGGMMTLEDFLVRAGAAETAEVKMETETERMYSLDSMTVLSRYSSWGRSGDWSGAESGGRKRKGAEGWLDRAAEQRQRRMIKNRESAARSRERKQAYQVELESLAVKLEEENERLLKEKAARAKERLEQLIERVIPVSEQRRPRRFLRKIHSMQW